MAHQHRRGRPVAWRYETPPREIVADPFTSAAALCDLLPTALGEAEAAGLSLIGQHLAKALHMAQAIAASGPARGDGAAAPAATRSLQ